MFIQHLKKKTKMSEALTELKPANAKHPEYLEMGGAEAEIPAVKEIGEALDSGETFIVVGGGSSGKTESLVTAFEQRKLKYGFLDLRNWTVSQLADESVRDACLEDPNLSDQARAYITGLKERLAGEGTDPADAAATVKRDYWADTSYGIKYAESHLLDVEIERTLMNGNSDEAGEDKSTLLPEASGQVLILDEFDLGIGDSLSPVEVESAAKLVKLAKANSSAQLGLVVHPAAVQDDRFGSSIRDALGEPREPRMVMMQHFPEQVEKAALEFIGISDELATNFMQDIQGLPSAYLDISTKPELRESLAVVSPEERLATLEERVAKKIARNKEIIFDRLSAPTKEYLIGMIQGNADQQPEPAAVREALINLYVSARDGEVTMPPIVKRTLAKELGIEQPT